MISRKDFKIRSEIPKPVDILLPEVEPLGVRDYLNYANLTANKNKVVLADKLVTARQIIENWTGRRLVQQTVDQIVDYDPKNNPDGIPFYISDAVGEITLRCTPVRQIVYIYVRDPFGNETLVDPLVYILQTVREPYAILSVQLGKVWPGVLRDLESIRIRTVCGYVSPITSVDTVYGEINAPGHFYNEGDTLTLSACFGTGDAPPQLPGGLVLQKNYYAVNVVPGVSLQLSLTLEGEPIVPTTPGSGQLFLGAIPKQILRGIMVTATADLQKDESDETSSFGDSQVPALAKDLCRRYKTSYL